MELGTPTICQKKSQPVSIRLKLILLSLATLSISACKDMTNDSTPVLPSVSLFSITEGRLFNTQDIPKGKSFVIIYFDPDCGHCQDLTNDILSKMGEFKDTKFYYVSDMPLDRLKLFEDYFNLRQYSKIMLLSDKDSKIREFMHPRGTPSIAFFDSKKKLHVIYDGGTEVPTIIKELSILQ